MRGIIESGGELTPRQSSYAKEGGWLGFAHWVRDKILTPLLPVPPDPPDSISGDEFKLPFNITTAANTTLVPPQSFNIELFSIWRTRQKPRQNLFPNRSKHPPSQ